MSHRPSEVASTPSSGNVFADLDLPDPDELDLKAELVYRISRIVAERELTQVQAAEVLGISQSKVAALLRGRLDGFSVERLLRCLTTLGCDIEIAVKPKAATHGRLKVA
ncbi:MAG: XRE family transcriptional regulator [Chloroflexi bacterium]|nr:XRE family transcriptional regulator [Chloroflexota bacterium]